MLPKLSETLKGIPTALVQAEPPKTYRWLTLVCLAALFLTGIVWFGSFFEWGNHTLDYFDWADISGPRFQFLRTAVRAGEFPLHISDPSTFHGTTLRYLAVSDSFISPQYLLLYRLSIQRFNLANVWLLYALGFAGLLVLRSRLRLSVISFAAVFFLFNFNGHLLAHYGVGHATWGGYFLFPWFVLLVFKLLDGDRSWGLTLSITALLFVIWLQGSFHQYVWLLMFLACLGVFVPRIFWMVVRTGVFVVLGSAFRILPSILQLGSYSASFDSGYPTLFSVWDSLVKVTDPMNSTHFIKGMVENGVGSWETTAFIGLLGGLFLVYFGVYRGLIDARTPFRALILPLGVIFLLCMGSLMGELRLLPIPIIQGERVSSRMFSVVLVFLLVLAAERFQRGIDAAPQKLPVLALSLLGLGINTVDLWADSNVWRISNGMQEFWAAFQAQKWSVNNNYGDTLYLWLVFGGLALSALVFGILGRLAWREARRKLVALSVDSPVENPPTP